MLVFLRAVSRRCGRRRAVVRARAGTGCRVPCAWSPPPPVLAPSRTSRASTGAARARAARMARAQVRVPTPQGEQWRVPVSRAGRRPVHTPARSLPAVPAAGTGVGRLSGRAARVCAVSGPPLWIARGRLCVCALSARLCRQERSQRPGRPALSWGDLATRRPNMHVLTWHVCMRIPPPLLPFPRACSWQCQKIRQFATKVDRRFQTSPSTSQCLMAPPRLWRSVGRPMRARAQRVSLSVCQPKHGRVDTHSR